jgi:hypothetical protein
MFFLLKNALKSFREGNKLNYLTCDNDDTIPEKSWYRSKNWKEENFIRYNATWEKSWKGFSDCEEVVGLEHYCGEHKFIQMANKEDLLISLELEPDNEHDKNAIKVMLSATVNNKYRTLHLGYLSRDTARKLKKEQEIEARPYSVNLGNGYFDFSIRIKVLIRSKSFNKIKNAHENKGE